MIEPDYIVYTCPKCGHTTADKPLPAVKPEDMAEVCRAVEARLLKARIRLYEDEGDE